MRIALIGSGNVGKALGSAWEKKGHTVVYGVRSPKGGSRERSIPEAVAEADVVVLAVPWSAIPSVLADKELFAGKILVDATNPIRSDFTGLAIGQNDSAGETVARLAPNAKVVKAFNTCGYNIMANPQFQDGAASMLVASDHSGAKETVIELANSIGFDAVDAGPLEQSRYLEASAWLWISIAMKYGAGREIAFRLMRR